MTHLKMLVSNLGLHSNNSNIVMQCRWNFKFFGTSEANMQTLHDPSWNKAVAADACTSWLTRLEPHADDLDMMCSFRCLAARTTIKSKPLFAWNGKAIFAL